jgi:uncharacterized protein (TIGR03435 family)
VVGVQGYFHFNQPSVKMREQKGRDRVLTQHPHRPPRIKIRKVRDDVVGVSPGARHRQDGQTQTVTVTADFLTPQALATALYGIGAVDRPVINTTGLAQIFDLQLEFSSAYLPGALPANAPPAANDPSIPSVFTALEDQLGLKLVSAKGPQEFLVIDSVERPSEN